MKPKKTDSQAEQRKFFKILFEGMEGFIEIRCIDPKKHIRRFFYNTIEIEKIISQLNNQNQILFQNANVYFGVCPRRREEMTKEERAIINEFCLDKGLGAQYFEEIQKDQDFEELWHWFIRLMELYNDLINR